jgi:hypothetical protein
MAKTWPCPLRFYTLPSSCNEFPPTAIILITVFDFAFVAIVKALSIWYRKA